MYLRLWKSLLHTTYCIVACMNYKFFVTTMCTSGFATTHVVVSVRHPITY